ncbi:MAG TPA: NAD(P)H-binding protein [Cyclobacteriaceae bacterium]
MKIALLAGSTGLIGRQLLQLLLQDEAYSTVKAISRKPLEINHPKLENIVLHNFDDITSAGDKLKADDVFCCLGTTMKQAGSKEAFEKVDYVYPLEIALLARNHGSSQYLLVSALGANPASAIYYNQIKGRTETSINVVGFDSIHIFRPSLLLGDRAEPRTGEDAAKVVYKIFGFLIPLKYKSIDAARVARAMLSFAKENKPGRFIHESAELQRF